MMLNNEISEVPEGYVFKPTDEQLIGFLLRKSMGLPSKSQINPILDKDLYGASPWVVFEDVSDAQWITCREEDDDGVIEFKNDKKTVYTYTKLSKVSEGKNRTAGCGTWNDEASAVKIYDMDTGDLIGSRKLFNFRSSKGKQPDNGDHWIMHEFSLAGVCLDRELRYPDLVVCRITKSSEEEKGNRIGEGCSMIQLLLVSRITPSSDSGEGCSGVKEMQHEEGFADEM